MEIKRLMNSNFVKMLVSQQEFNELYNGLEWSTDQSTMLYGGLAEDMKHKMQEFVTEGRSAE